jgi:hypothetical protein
VTKFRLQGPSLGFQPDTVIWRGNEFIVRAIDDYSAYGAGFVQALASSVEVLDRPPQ